MTTAKPTLRLWHFLGIVLPTVFMQMRLLKDKLTELCTKIKEMIFNLLSKRLDQWYHKMFFKAVLHKVLKNFRKIKNNCGQNCHVYLKISM